MLKNKESHKFSNSHKLEESHKPFGFKFTNLTPGNLNSQASLEFLTTYAWALLSILITLGALYYFGVFDFSKFLPEKCIFTSQLECLAFVMDTNEIRIKLVNNLGETITVESMTIKNNNEPPLDCTTTPTTLGPITGWDAGEELDLVYGSCSGGGYISKERNEAKVTLTYFAEATTPLQPRHTVTGRLQGRVK